MVWVLIYGPFSTLLLEKGWFTSLIRPSVEGGERLGLVENDITKIQELKSNTWHMFETENKQLKEDMLYMICTADRMLIGF